MERHGRVRASGMSFVVRVWNDGDDEPQMRGEIENIRTGEKRFFLSYWSLLSLLEAWTRDLEAVG